MFWGRDVLGLGTFCSWDVLRVGTFWGLGRFGAGTFCIGLFCLRTFCLWTFSRSTVENGAQVGTVYLLVYFFANVDLIHAV
jgi:hypothetical protein